MKTWDEILNVSLTNNVTLGKEPHLYKPVFSYLQRRIALLPISCPDQSILKEINPECSLEGLMLKLQYFHHLMRRADSFEKTLMLGKIEGGRRGWQRMRWLDGITPTQWTWVWVSLGVGDGQRSLTCCSPWGRKESDVTEWLNWNELSGNFYFKYEL